MEAIYEKLSILDYPITKDFFLLFWGSKVEWEKLKKENNIVLNDEESYSVNIKVKLDIERKQELHLEIYSMYLEYFEDNKTLHYEELQELIDLLKKASYHSRKCDQYNELINAIYSVFKWLIFWNISIKWFWKYIEEISIGNLDDDLKARLIYCKNFKKVLPRFEMDNYEDVNQDLNSLLKKNSDLRFQFQVVNLLGLLNLQAGNYKLSFKKFEKCRKIAEDLNSQQLRGIVLLNKSTVCNQLDNSDKSITLLKKTMVIFKEEEYYHYVSKYNYLNLLFGQNEDIEDYLPSTEEIINLIDKYPDVVKLFVGLKRKVAIKKNEYQLYFFLKSIGLYIGQRLYQEDYLREFFSLINRITDWAKDKRSEVRKGLKFIIDTYKTMEMDDERLFFETYQKVLSQEPIDISDYKAKIKNSSLKDLLCERIKNLQKILVKDVSEEETE